MSEVCPDRPGREFHEELRDLLERHQIAEHESVAVFLMLQMQVWRNMRTKRVPLVPALKGVLQ